MRFSNSKLIPIVIFFLLAAVGAFFISGLRTNAPQIINFYQCTTIYPVTQTFPLSCSTPDGRVFFQSRTDNNGEQERFKYIGILEGLVKINLKCPDERSEEPCPAPAESYASREVLIYRGDKKAILIKSPLKQDGSYYLELPPGNYILDIQRLLSAGLSKDLPHSFSMKAGDRQKFNFSIDTEIK